MLLTNDIETQPRSDAGFSIIEVTIALAFAAVGALTLISAMGTAGHADDAANKRSLASRECHAIMQDILADSSTLDFADFVTKWSTPANQTINVSGLEDPANPGNDAQAIVALDQADPDRVGLTVTISWNDGGRTETLVVPSTVTEIVQ